MHTSPHVSHIHFSYVLCELPTRVVSDHIDNHGGLRQRHFPPRLPNSYFHLVQFTPPASKIWVRFYRETFRPGYPISISIWFSLRLQQARFGFVSSSNRFGLFLSAFYYGYGCTPTVRSIVILNLALFLLPIHPISSTPMAGCWSLLRTL